MDKKKVHLRKVGYKEDQKLPSLEEISRESDFISENVYESEEECKNQINSYEKKRIRSNTMQMQQPRLNPQVQILEQDEPILSENTDRVEITKRQQNFTSPQKNTLRDYQEMISDDEDGINSRAYRFNKNSKKLLKQQIKQCETSDCNQDYKGVNFVDLRIKPNSDLSDYNNFLQNGSEQESSLNILSPDQKKDSKKVKKSLSPFYSKEDEKQQNIPPKRGSHTFFELPEPMIQRKAIDSVFQQALGGKRKRRITTMTLEEMREKIRKTAENRRLAEQQLETQPQQQPIPDPTDDLSLDSDHAYLNTDFGSLQDHEIEWRLLKRIFVQYFTCLFAWIACNLTDEPKCGIPMKIWCKSYLFFRMFRNVHNGIGVLLHLNDTPFYYTPYARLFIFWTFELFEFVWMLYGEYLFYFSSSNICNMNKTYGQQQNLAKNYIFIIMMSLSFKGFILIITQVNVFYELFINYYTQAMHSLNEYNHQVNTLRSVSKFRYRIGFYHSQKDCIICWDVFRSKQYVTILNCHKQHFFHTKCIKDWISKGNNSCPLCRQEIVDGSQQGANFIDLLKYQLNQVLLNVKHIIKAPDESSNTESAAEQIIPRSI